IPLYLKNALSQGLYKTYQKFERNDARIKGVIDIPRHIRQNIPFAGKVAYTSRESSYDNDITELIRHTIEYIKTKKYGKAILSYDNDTKGYISQIIEATPLYSAQIRQRVINKNIKPFHHPFYLAYKPLQKLCMMILCHKKLKYAISEKTVYGILFDGAWLWEEYLATILTKCGFIHPRNKDGENSITIYKGNPRYPDFYKGKQQKSTTIVPNENYILDAKYKPLDKTSINREDLHQLVTYMHILPAISGGLIYPYDKEYPNNDIQISDGKTLYGLGGTIQTFGIPIPQNASSYNDFVLSMKNTEDNLQKIFSSIK
ncbi:MAG: hypothetical protein J6Y01_03510, partial [Spirochaetales bacterium]|nr:hypothetical protein [Spirochaetales bacterium]